MDIRTAEYRKPEKTYHKVPHLVYSCQYHVIFCPKYRRKILTGAYEERTRELFYETAKKNNFDIVALEIMPDHVHMIIDCDPRFDVCQCVKRLKGVTAHVLRSEFPELKSRMPCFWTRGAFISSVGTVSIETVKQYIESQKDV